MQYRMLRALNATALVCAGIALAATLPLQDATTLELDPAQTKIDFTLSDVLHTVHGTFKLKRGAIQFDPLTGQAGGSIVVDAASGDSGSHGRDRKMNRDILESQRYPEITFTPRRVEGRVTPEGESQVQVHGVFDLHGTGHEIVLPAVVRNDGGELTATLHFDVPYVQWGLKNPSTLFLRVGDKVAIDLHAVAHVRGPMVTRSRRAAF